MGRGLYYNINKKRKEGRKMRKKGAKGAPTAKNFKDAAKTARKPMKKTAPTKEGVGGNMPKSKYSAKQKKLARVAPPRDKITGADFKKLRKKKKKPTKRRKK